MDQHQQITEALAAPNPNKALTRLVSAWGMDGMTQENAAQIFGAFLEKQAAENLGTGVMLSQRQFLVGHIKEKIERCRFDLAEEGTMPVLERRKLKQRANQLLVVTVAALALVVLLAGLAAPTWLTLLVALGGVAAGCATLVAGNRALRGRTTMPANKGWFTTWVAPGMVLACALVPLLLASGVWHPLNEITFVPIYLTSLLGLAIAFTAAMFLLRGRIDLVVMSETMYGMREKKRVRFGTYGLPLAFLVLSFGILPPLGAELGARSPCTRVLEMGCAPEKLATLYSKDGCYGDAFADAECRLAHCECADGFLVCDQVGCDRQEAE